MSKDKKQDISPYFISAEFSLEGLANAPEEAKNKPEKMFLDTCVRAVVLYSKIKNGLGMQEHRKFFKFRDTIQKAIDAEKIKDIEIEGEAFKFFLRCWNEQKPDATMNELVMRADKNVMEAISQHDKVFNESQNKDNSKQ